MAIGEKHAIARNAVWNLLGTGVEAVTGFILAPFLIHTLGATRYGLWIVLGSLAGYFGLFDLGIRSSIGRYVAYHHGKQDQAGINRVLSAALVFLGMAAVVALLGLWAIVPFLDRWFDIPPEQTVDAQQALGLVAVNLALSLIVNAFDATLWGFQRFDLTNAVDIPAALCRLGLTVALIGTSQLLVTLAVINLAVLAAAGLGKAALCWYQNPALRISPAAVNRSVAKELFAFGSWSFLYSVSRTFRGPLALLLIGSFLGVALATPYSVAGRLLNQQAVVLAAVTGILTPLATRLHAQEQVVPQQRLFIQGGRWCMTLTLFLTLGLILLGKPLITLWVGPEMALAATLLTIIASGEILPNSQFVTNGIIFAKAQQRLLACLGLVETIAFLGLAVWLVPWYGLIGGAMAVVVPGFVCRGIAPLIQGCYLSGVSIASYILEALLVPIACVLLPAVVLILAVTFRMPDSWPALVLYASGYTLVFAVGLLPFVGFDFLSRVFGFVAKRNTTVLVPSSEEP